MWLYENMSVNFQAVCDIKHTIPNPHFEIDGFYFQLLSLHVHVHIYFKCKINLINQGQ